MTTNAPSLSRWLSAADSTARLDPWDCPDELSYALPDAAENTDVARTAVLTISGMPRELRPRIETAMAVSIPSESQLTVPGNDPMTAEWFTSWSRDRVSESAPGPAHEGVLLECRQVLTGEAAELDRLSCMVSGLSQAHGFAAEVRVVD